MDPTNLKKWKIFKIFELLWHVWACLTTPPKMTQSICSFNGYAPACKKLYIYTSYCFWDTKYIKIRQSGWLRVFLHLTWELYFFQACSFCRTRKTNMVHPLNKKIYTSTEKILCKIQKKLFLGYFWALSQKYYFLPLCHSNFVWNSTKTLWAVLEKKCFPTDILAYWPTDILTVVIS